jgi:hypothetical protein
MVRCRLLSEVLRLQVGALVRRSRRKLRDEATIFIERLMLPLMTRELSDRFDLGEDV